MRPTPKAAKPTNMTVVAEQLKKREEQKTREQESKKTWAEARGVELSASSFHAVTERSEGGKPMVEHSDARLGQAPSASPVPASGVKVNNDECCVIL